MTRQVRLLAALILVTAVGLLWPAEIAAQRRPPAGGGGARTGHAVPRTYHSGGGYHSGGYHSSGSYYRPSYYRPYYYRPYYYSRYCPYYYAAGTTRPISASALELDSGLAGDRSARRTGMGIPIHIPTAMRRRTRYAQPYAGYGSGYPGPNTMQMQQPAPAPQASYPAQQAAPQYSTAENGSFGTLSLRVTPVDATILIDGQVWDRPQGQDRFSIDLVEGTHRVEVHQQGYGPYARTVQIHGGGTLTINVSLSTGGGGSQVPQLAVRRTVPLR